MLPGGIGTRKRLEDQDTLAWIRRFFETGARVTSVCTGSLPLAKDGLFKDRAATTHWNAVETHASLDSTIQIREKRYADCGIVTSQEFLPELTWR